MWRNNMNWSVQYREAVVSEAEELVQQSIHELLESLDFFFQKQWRMSEEYQIGQIQAQSFLGFFTKINNRENSLKRLIAGKLSKMLYNSVGKRCRKSHLREQQWEWRRENKFEKYLEGRSKRKFYPYGCGNEGEKGVKDNSPVCELIIACNF